MIAFPSMLVSAAEEAGMKFPEDPDEFDAKKYPHFQVFCNVTLGQSWSYPGAHFDNAKIIAEISEDKIMKITFADLLALGLHVRT